MPFHNFLFGKIFLPKILSSLGSPATPKKNTKTKPNKKHIISSLRSGFSFVLCVYLWE